MSNCVVLPHRKSWIEGSASSTELQDKLEQEYVKDVKMWMISAMDNINNASAIGVIYSCIKASGNLKHYLVDDKVDLMIHEGKTLIDCLPMSAITDEDKMATLRAQCSPFKTITSTSSVARARNSQGLTAMELADAIAAINNCKEKAKLHSGVLKTMAMFVTCAFDIKEARTLKLLDLTISMEAMLNCMKPTSKSEHVDEMACMVDTNNHNLPVGNKHSLYCNQKFHNGVYVATLVDVNWAKEPLNNLTMEQKCIHITDFLPMHKEHIDILMRKNDQHDIEDSVEARD